MFNNQLNAKNVKSKPKYVHYGKGQTSKIVVNAIMAGGEYFILEVMKPTASDKSAKKKLAVYFTVNAVGTVPAVAGTTNLEVALDADPTILETIAALKTALESDSDIRFVDTNETEVTITAKWFGETAIIVEGTTPTAFTYSIELAGFGGFLGATQDGVEFSPEPEIEDINSDQTGGAPLTSLMNGLKISLKTKIIELSKERFNMLYGKMIGTNFTPASGTEVMGFGIDKVGQSIANLTGELILLPLNFDAQNPDYSEAYFFFECSAIPGGLVMSGSAQTLEINFKPYIDGTKINKAAYGVKGDGFQKGIRA
jgi:hypothetical protein